MMADDEAGFEIDNSEPTAPGERLRAAREAKGLSVDDVSAATRIPKRHLETIEDGDFAVLPGRTYAIGFSRSYAKAVGLNDEEIVNEVREQLGIEDPAERLRDGTIQTEDPTRLPSRGLVFGSIIAASIEKRWNSCSESCPIWCHEYITMTRAFPFSRNTECSRRLTRRFGVRFG